MVARRERDVPLLLAEMRGRDADRDDDQAEVREVGAVAAPVEDQRPGTPAEHPRVFAECRGGRRRRERDGDERGGRALARDRQREERGQRRGRGPAERAESGPPGPAPRQQWADGEQREQRREQRSRRALVVGGVDDSLESEHP